MPRKIRKKKYLDKNVWEAALERIEYLYRTFDKVVVSFSGGKDSTAVLNATIEVARKLGKLPVEVDFHDEEAIHPPTIEYVERVSKLPEVKLNWYALEFKHRNACAMDDPYWYCWEKGKEDLWTRPMPEQAITEHPKFIKGMTFQEFSTLIYGVNQGRVAMLTGVRTEESLRRYRVIAAKTDESYIAGRRSAVSFERDKWAEKFYPKWEAFQDNSISQGKDFINLHTSIYMCHPVYDWSSKDVWLGVSKFKWDYNRTYDIFNQTKWFENFLGQRVCPPFGEEPIKGLWVYAEAFPDMWHKMIKRVPGANTAVRYSNTELYGKNSQLTKPEGMSYQEYAKILLSNFKPETQKMLSHQINELMKTHFNKTTEAIPDDEPHILSGASWQLFAKLIVRGDYKYRIGQNMQMYGEKTLKKSGLTWEQAKARHGK